MRFQNKRVYAFWGCIFNENGHTCFAYGTLSGKLTPWAAISRFTRSTSSSRDAGEETLF